jgi:hypothetical protein
MAANGVGVIDVVQPWSTGTDYVHPAKWGLSCFGTEVKYYGSSACPIEIIILNYNFFRNYMARNILYEVWYCVSDVWLLN